MIKEKIKQIAEEELYVEDFDFEKDMVDFYQFDSITVMDLIMVIEDEFDIRFEDKEIMELSTGNDLIKTIEEKIRQK